MKRLWLLALLLLVGYSTVPAEFKPPITAADDYNPVYPIGCGSNTNPNASGCATFGTSLYTFLAKEQPAELTEMGFGNFVVSGCLGTSGAGLVMTPSSCIARNANIRGTETGSITYANNTTTWVAMDACNQTPSGCQQNNANLPNFTRVSGTHYLTDAIDATQPAMASDSQLLMKVVTSGGAITAVTDLRTTSVTVPGGSIVDPLAINNINPKPPLNGGQSIGPFNGARSGEKNLGDFNPSRSLQTGTCTTTAGLATMTCSALPADMLAASAIGKYVAIPHGGATPASIAPVLTIAPTHTTNSYGGTYNTLFASGCATPTVYAYGDSTGATLAANQVIVSNPAFYISGQTITVSGHSYVIQSIDATDSIYTLTTNLQNSFSTSVVTGNDCTHTWRFKAAFVEASGALSPLSSEYTTTVGPNAANWGNFIDVFGTWDAHAVGIQIFSCEDGGSSCTGAETMTGGDVPGYVYNAQTNNDYSDDPLLAVTAGVKHQAAKFWFHEIGKPYGHDIVNGTALPTAGGENGIMTGLKLVSVSGAGPYTVTLSGPVTSSATNAPIMFDDEPATASAYAASVDSDGNATTLYVPKGVSRLAQQFNAQVQTGGGQTVGLRIRGDGGPYYNNGGSSGGQSVHSPTQFVWSGRAFQGQAVYLYHQTSPKWEAVSLSDTNGSTMGVGIDFDGLTNVGTANTAGMVIDSAIGTAEHAIRAANVNTSNLEFMEYDRDYLNEDFTGTSGLDAIDIMSTNALMHHMNEVHTGSAIGILDYYGTFHFEDSNIGGLDSVGLWISPYTSGPSKWDVGRYEHAGRAVYTPVQGGEASQGLTINGIVFAGMQLYPDCMFVATGNGGTILSGNQFQDVILGLLGAPASATGTACNGYISASNNVVSFLTSQSNFYGLNVSTPFSLLSATQFTSIQDHYLPVSTGIFTAVSLPAPPTPTSLLAISTCAPTISQSIGWQTTTACNIGYNFHVFFQLAAGSLDFHGTAELNINGQAIADFQLQAAHDMSSGTVTQLTGATASPAILQVSTTCGNTGTLNLCFSNNNGFELENLTSFNPSNPVLSTLVTFHNGAK